MHAYTHISLHLIALQCTAMRCLWLHCITDCTYTCICVYIYIHTFIFIPTHLFFISSFFFSPSLSLSLKGKRVQRCGRVCANIQFLQEIYEIEILHYFISRCYFPNLFRIYRDLSLIFSRQADLCLAKAWKLCGFGAHCPCGKGLTIGQ